MQSLRLTAWLVTLLSSFAALAEIQENRFHAPNRFVLRTDLFARNPSASTLNANFDITMIHKRRKVLTNTIAVTAINAITIKTISSVTMLVTVTLPSTATSTCILTIPSPFTYYGTLNHKLQAINLNPKP